MPKEGEVYSSDAPGGVGTGQNGESGGTYYPDSGKQVQFDKNTGDKGKGERVTRDHGQEWHPTDQNRAKGSSTRHK